MSHATAADIDLVKELRLRRWARQNWVAAEERSPEWHGVVLDEMRRRDEELANRPAVEQGCRSYVPLAPTDWHRLDAAHHSADQPNLSGIESLQPGELI